jgi:hypothetical protein
MNQPVVICVDVEPLQFYTSGIIQKACSETHTRGDSSTQISSGYCALAVGLTTGAVPFYKVKASFSDETKSFWGEKGYFRVARNMTSGSSGMAASGSLCIASHASFPTV